MPGWLSRLSIYYVLILNIKIRKTVCLKKSGLSSQNYFQKDNFRQINLLFCWRLKACYTRNKHGNCSGMGFHFGPAIILSSLRTVLKSMICTLIRIPNLINSLQECFSSLATCGYYRYKDIWPQTVFKTRRVPFSIFLHVNSSHISDLALRRCPHCSSQCWCHFLWEWQGVLVTSLFCIVVSFASSNSYFSWNKTLSY